MTEETHQTTEGQGQPELKQVLGAMVFASRKPITAGELRGVLAQVDQSVENAAHPFGKIQESDILTALEQVKIEMAERKLGIILVEVAGGFRFQTDPAGGPWVRQLLNLDKPARLSKPALETLAIIAYRQPTTRAEIEALRGVNVDAMMRHLLELQLIRIVGRSDLPGRPLMYGTTQLFLEHFGLSSVKNLPGVEQLSRRDAERVRRETGRTTDDRRQTTDDGQQKTEEANADLSAIALATAEHPTLLRPSASEGKLPNAQRPMEEQTEDGSAEGKDADKTDDGRQTTDDRQRKAEEDTEEEAEEDEGEENEDDDDDEEDDEGKEE